MKIRIKEFKGRSVCSGVYPKPGVRLRKGEVFEFKPGEEDAFDLIMSGGNVEEVVEPVRRGRPPKEAPREVA